MNIYDFAMKMEKESENYYLELIKKTDNVGLQNIFKMLANEEVKHYKILEQMSKNDEGTYDAETNILNDVKNIFNEMRGEDIELKPNESQAKLYLKAQNIEENSYKFYLDKSKSVEIESQKEIFLKLAEEEKKHMFLMENIAEFITRPDTWLENAEFNHLDEY